MRWFKLIVGVLILIFIGLFINQNLPTFQSNVPFTYYLYFTDRMQWSHSLYSVLLLSGGIGFLLGILVMMKPYFGVRRKLNLERQEKKQVEAAKESAPVEQTAEAS